MVIIFILGNNLQFSESVYDRQNFKDFSFTAVWNHKSRTITCLRKNPECIGKIKTLPIYLRPSQTVRISTMSYSYPLDLKSENSGRPCLLELPWDLSIKQVSTITLNTANLLVSGKVLLGKLSRDVLETRTATVWRNKVIPAGFYAKVSTVRSSF